LVVGHEHSDDEALAAAAKPSKALVHLAARRTVLCEAAAVVLPTPAWVSQEGTWQNTDGLLQRLTPVYPPPGDAQPAYFWLNELAERLGVRLELSSITAIRAAIAAKVPALAAVASESRASGAGRP
jgi:NADH dehydrogenase/NADH:ubiquinone oxidoreductase subunit G